jgi:8-oxo-dGTP pyrophosphatase MutT (NUDIX family)
MTGSRFEPAPRHGRRYDVAPEDARAAAVLVLLYPWRGQWHLPLTLRPGHLPLHPGQISLPGGAVEPGESSRAAAVREFCEELGAAGHSLELMGQLSPLYVEASNYRVEPWVAFSRERPPMEANPAEVEQLLEVPLAHLLDTANFGCHERTRHGQPYSAPHFAWCEHRIWGATCMILGELVTLLEEPELRHWVV